MPYFLKPRLGKPHSYRLPEQLESVWAKAGGNSELARIAVIAAALREGLIQLEDCTETLPWRVVPASGPRYYQLAPNEAIALELSRREGLSGKILAVEAMWR